MSDITIKEATLKVNQLQLVFSKAMDVTFESLGPNDIKNCFGELRNEFGNSLDGKLVQQLALSKNRLQVCVFNIIHNILYILIFIYTVRTQGEFNGLCSKYNLVEEIAQASE
jgi:hypothetical protein